MSERALRRELIDTCLAMNRAGINQGKSGNASARIEDGFLVTPTGIPYDALTLDDIMPMRFDGSHQGKRLPSSEWRFHRDILAARPEINAIVHTHANYATTLACLGRSIPPFHYMIAKAGGSDIHLLDHHLGGRQRLLGLGRFARMRRVAIDIV